MDGQETQRNQGIQVISRAADILRLLGQDTEGLSLGQIAQRVDLPRSTVQRIVSALSVEGFITVDKGNAGIKLGPEIQTLAQASSSVLKDKLRPIMKRIAKETGETVDLAILEAGKMLFIDQIVGSQRLRTVSSIGESFPLTTTANGKAALACLSGDEAKDLIRTELTKYPINAKSVDQILNDVEKIRAGELAKDENEHTEGVCALGFAVQDRGGDIYALSIPVPSTRFDRVQTKLAEILKTIRDEIA